MVDDQGGAGGRLGGDPGDVVEEVAPVDDRRLPACGRHCGLKTLRPVGLAGPDQAGQPFHVARVVHVERVEVDPGSPGNLGGELRQRYRPT